MALDLTNEFISQTYQRVVQYQNGVYYDGLGNAISRIARHDFSGSYSYCGTAPTGSLESDPAWNIARIQISTAGNTTTQYAYNVAWTTRYTAIYT